MNPTRDPSNNSFPLTRNGAAILAQALKKAVNDETFNNLDDEVEAVRMYEALKELANRRVI